MQKKDENAIRREFKARQTRQIVDSLCAILVNHSIL